MINPISISVLMPVYNAGKYLHESIDSILSQTFPDFEFIVIDDGSTDNSSIIINSYSDSRIKLFQNDKNSGIVNTLNKGIDLSSGKYIARMDADDISFPDRLLKQFRFMENNDNIALCYGNIKTIDNYGNTISVSKISNDITPFSWRLLWGNPVFHPTVMIRKDILIKKNLRYNIEALHTEDYDLWCRIAMVSEITLLDEYLLYYRVDENSLFHKNRFTALTNALHVNSDYIKTISGEKPPEFHIYLTTFAQSKQYDFNIINIQRWMKYLLGIFEEKYKGNHETLTSIQKDIVTRLTSISDKQHWYYLIKNLLITTIKLNKTSIIILHVILRKIKRFILNKLFNNKNAISLFNR